MADEQTPFIVVIPARYGSSRLPGKPLIEVAGAPVIEHVYRRGAASGAQRVVVATDDERIAQACQRFGAEVVITRAEHVSGTERIAEVVERLGVADATIVVNLQGDEPLMPSELPALAAAGLAQDRQADIATLAVPIESAAELMDPAVVKVVCNRKGRAQYFSRAVIPWDRERLPQIADEQIEAGGWLRHLGLYAYRGGFLRSYLSLEPAPAEQLEQLEQLRALWHGYTIQVAVSAQRPGPGVDTSEDIQVVTELLEEYSG